MMVKEQHEEGWSLSRLTIWIWTIVCASQPLLWDGLGQYVVVLPVQ